MEEIFTKVLTMSLSASWLILAVIALRFLLKRSPKWIPCVLWGIVAIRLICPFSVETAFSLIPRTESVSNVISHSEYVTQVTHSSDITPKGYSEEELSVPVSPYEEEPAVSQARGFMGILSMIWMFGVGGILFVALVEYIRLRRKVSAAVPGKGQTWYCDSVESPYILGVFHPHIYLPSSIDGEVLEYVTAHENAHLQRRDHWWKVIGYLLVAIHWFNPLVWISYALFCKDTELACDEMVISGYDMTEKKAYANALLSCSQRRRRVFAYPLAFGEVGVKTRIRSVLNYRKPPFWIGSVGLLICVIVAACFLTNPKRYLSIPAEPVVFETEDHPDGYMIIHWEEEDRKYVPYMPFDPSLVGDCIGYYGSETDPVYVCKVKGLSETEWICDTLTRAIDGHSDCMVWREVGTTAIPEGWSSEYDWNKEEYTTESEGTDGVQDVLLSPFADETYGDRIFSYDEFRQAYYDKDFVNYDLRGFQGSTYPGDDGEYFYSVSCRTSFEFNGELYHVDAEYEMAHGILLSVVLWRDYDRKEEILYSNDTADIDHEGTGEYRGDLDTFMAMP